MKEELLNLELPKSYEPDLFHYVDGCDTTPQWPELAKKGYTWDEHMKLNKLVSIESFKHILQRDADELSNHERSLYKKAIKKSIAEYNAM